MQNSLRFALATIVLASPVLEAQVPRVVRPAPGVTIVTRGDAANRAMLGVTFGGSGPRDTLGLLVMAITPGGPAERAGIQEGDRIAQINDVRLQLSREDAGDPDMRGILGNRASRELRRLNPGDEVTLRVYSSGATRTVRARLTSMEELRPATAQTRMATSERAVLGVTLGGGASRRDTLGLMLTNVAQEGPAARAGLDVGDRIASINGVDVRVRAADAGDDAMSGIMSNRFTRELAKVKPNDSVELRVWQNGQWRTISVRSVSADSLYGGRGNQLFFPRGGSIEFGDPPVITVPAPRAGGTMMLSPLAPLSPTPGPGRVWFEI